MLLLLLSLPPLCRESVGSAGLRGDPEGALIGFLPGCRAAMLRRGSGEGPAVGVASGSVSVRGGTRGLSAAAGGPVDGEDPPHVSRASARGSPRRGRGPVGAVGLSGQIG